MSILSARRALTAAATVVDCLATVAVAPGAAATPITPLAPTSPPGAYAEQNLAADRTATDFFYRIPALAHLGGGVVLASWDARPGSATDAPNPNSIVQRRSTDNGVTWGPMTTIAAGHASDATGPQYGYSDPSYVVDRQAGKVFAFFVYSKDVGFGGSTYGNDDDARTIISAAVVESADGGMTWSTPRLITSVVKPGASASSPQPGDVRTMFAASGEGVQLRYGAYAGRLVQQFSGYVRQENGTESFQAYSVYSDDHGVTWVKGTPVGTGMDENKVVELSDGRVMLNSRDSAGSRFRKVAYSTDGGQTYGPLTLDRQLIDPTNNGSITRLYPDVAQGSAQAKRLLFTNSASQAARENVTARVSCDDGTTWPGRRVLRSGFSAYSTAARLDSGQLGVFYEASYTNDMEFARFDDAWLNYVCAPVSTPDLSMQAGATAQVPLAITNQEATALSGGSVTIATPTGWTAPAVSVPDIAPGATVTVTVPLTAPSNAAGAQRLDAVFTAADGRTSHYDVVVTPQGAAQVGLTIVGTAPTRDVVANPYAAGEVLTYSLRVTSTANVTADAVPTASSFEAGILPPATGAPSVPNCRWRNLAAGGAYICSTPSHVLTAADIAAGWFRPTATFTITSTADATLTKTVNFAGAPVFLRDSATIPLSASISGERSDTTRDLALEPYAAGELVPYRYFVANTSPFVETIVPTAGVFAPLVPPGGGNCRWTNLGVGASYPCATPRHTVTQAEVDAGFFRATSTWTASATGKTTVTYNVDGGEIDLLVRQPGLDGTSVPTWLDADGDRYAGVGEVVEVVRKVTNTGNTSLTDLATDGIAWSGTTLALGESLAVTQQIVLTDADLAAGAVQVPGFTATAHNGDKVVTDTVEAVTVTLSVKPAQPTTKPKTHWGFYWGRVSPVDLGLERSYVRGQTVVANNLEYGQWYYVYVNGSGKSLGWHFPTLDNQVVLTLPESAWYGVDTLVVLDSQGREVAFDRLVVVPKWLRQLTSANQPV